MGPHRPGRQYLTPEGSEHFPHRPCQCSAALRFLRQELTMLRGRRESLRISASRGDEELRRTVMQASREVSFRSVAFSCKSGWSTVLAIA